MAWRLQTHPKVPGCRAVAGGRILGRSGACPGDQDAAVRPVRDDRWRVGRAGAQRRGRPGDGPGGARVPERAGRRRRPARGRRPAAGQLPGLDRPGRAGRRLPAAPRLRPARVAAPGRCQRARRQGVRAHRPAWDLPDARLGRAGPRRCRRPRPRPTWRPGRRLALAATLDTLAVVGGLPAQPVVHLDAGYDYQPCRQALAARGMLGEIATRGVPAPIQASRRWPVERTHAWGNQYGKLRWCTERRRLVVEFWLALANAAIVCGRLIRRAWTHYRWDGRPPPPPMTAMDGGVATLPRNGVTARYC